MKPARDPRLVGVLVLIASMISVMSAGLSSQNRDTQPAGLRIVVIEGEDAVNVIQQKTSVAPIVEVRDRNNQPVAGAVVRFAVQGGRATFGGARTLAVTTDIAGRAAAAGFTPTASGAVQISATAAFQGQTAAAVTIAQTNVMTAAQAAAVSAAGGSSGGAASGTGAGAGAGGGAGGGVSATTIGIIGGAVAAGAVVATQTLGGPSGTPYTGQYSGDIILPANSGFCGFTERINSGTLTLTLDHIDASSVSGTAKITEDHSTIYNAACGGIPTRNFGDEFETSSLTGTSSSLAFTIQRDNQFGSGAGAGIRTITAVFSGSLSGNDIVGTLVRTEANRPASGGPGPTANGTAQFAVTLRQ